MLAPVRTVAPTETPVTLAEAKAHVRASEFDDDDAFITALIDAATAHVDGYTGILGRALVTQTWRHDFCEWPADGVLRLPLAPVASITSVKYSDADNAEQTVTASGNYALLADARGPFARFTSGFTAPALYDERQDRVRVTYVAGYGAATAVPAAIKAAMLLMIGHWYRSREAVVVGQTPADLPMGVDALLTPYRRVWCG